MKTKLFLILTLSIILLTFTSCGSGVPQEKYDKALKQLSNLEEISANNTARIATLQEQLSQAKPPTYFENRTAIENWLKTVKKLGVSKDPEEWLQYALYYQKKALEAGYIISVSYTFSDNKDIAVTCDIVTEDGWFYYFNPNKLELKDTRFRVDMIEPKELEATAIGTYQ